MIALVLMILGIFYKSKNLIKRLEFLNMRGPTLQSFKYEKKTIVNFKNIDKNGNFINKFNKKKGIFLQKDTNIRLQMRTNNNTTMTILVNLKQQDLKQI